MRDFTNDTDDFLHQVRREAKNNTLLYNEKPNKINYIKEYMAQEEVDFEEAA